VQSHQREKYKSLEVRHNSDLSFSSALCCKGQWTVQINWQYSTEVVSGWTYNH